MCNAGIGSSVQLREKINQLQEDKITKENLNLQIKEATNTLLEMAKEHSWNKISNEVRYVINTVKTEITEVENLFDRNRMRKKILEGKERVNLDSAIKQLKSDFDNIYLIELYVFKAKKNETIVEIEILEKSQLEDEYRKTVADKSPMLHCKVAIPPYKGLKGKGKFDINWQLETIEYKWKMFWWRRKINKKLKAAPNKV